jgi:hypothetical protein
MKLNVENFKEVLKKATLNFSIETVQLKLTYDKIISRMIIQHSKDAIVILDLPNNCIDIKRNQEYVFNFSEPAVQLMPFLNLIDDDEQKSDVEIKIADEKVSLIAGNQKSNIFFCAPAVVTVFSANAPREGLKYFVEFMLNDNFVRYFNKIRKIGMRFGKIYYGVENGVLYMETTDKTNMYSNALRFDIMEIKEPNKVLLFDYKPMTDIMSVVGDDFDKFKISFTYLEEQKLGMVYLEKNDQSEKYYLMSKSDG